MSFLVFLIINIATFLLTELLRPKPNIEDAKPAGLGDFQVPTATEGRVVPLIWGRVKMAGPNVVWYGDLVADPITEKIKTGLFSSQVVTIGFRYSIGLQMALCRGPVDLLINIRNDGSFCWGEEAPSADANLVPTDAGAIYFIDEPSFFGGEESGGGGGLVGGGRIYPGTETQVVSAYLAQFQTPTPFYRGTCFITFERGEIGLGPTLRAFEFEIQRIPDGLDLATLQPGDEEIDLGANPMNVIFEVLTNTEWGLARDSGLIDLVNFRAQAAILKTEGQGFAWIMDRVQDLLEIIKLVEQQVDGVLTEDPITGLFSFTLIRFDYTPGTLPLLDETNVLKVTRFQRPAWAETVNQISIEYTDRRKNYTTSFGLAQDQGNQDIVQAINSSKIRQPGVKNPTLANAIAWRELRALSTPLATLKIVTDRSQFAVEPGDVLEFSWARFGITRLPVRVTRSDRGKILDNEITLDVAQDVFAFAPGSFSDPIDTGWIAVSSEAKVSLRERLWEVPFQLSLDNERHLGVLCSRDGGLHIQFDIFSDRIDSPNFNFEGTELDFTPSALITAPISRDKGDITPFVQDIEIDDINDVTFVALLAAASTTIDPNNPANVFLIDEELIFFETVVNLGGGLVRLETCHFGLFDTVPADHNDNAALFFIGFGVGLLQREGPLPSPPGAIDVKILPTTVRNTLAIGSAATLSTTVGQRILNPIPPGDPFLNGNRFHDLDGWTRITGTLNFTWNTRNRVTQAFDTLQDDPDLSQPGNVGARIIVRRVDTTAIVVDFDNIFSDQFITTDFLPQSSPGIPDELDFTAEIVNRTVAGNQGQAVLTREFEIFGFGIDFGGDFGGETPNNGVVLSQGAPPFTPEPIPGSGQDRAWTIDFVGEFSTSERRRLLFSAFDSLAFQSLETGVQLDGSIQSSLTEFAQATEAVLLAIFTDRPFTVTRDGTQIIVTTRFGDFNLRRQDSFGVTPAGRQPGIGVQQQAEGPVTPIQQVVYIDFFESVDDATNPGSTVDVLSPTTDPVFATAGLDQTIFNIRALTFEARQPLGPLGLVSVRATGTRSAVDQQYSQTFQQIYDSLLANTLSQFYEVQGPVVLETGLTKPMNRGAILITLDENYDVEPQLFEAHGIGGPTFPPFKLLVKEGTPSLRGSVSGLAHVINMGFDRLGSFFDVTGIRFLFTLDGVVFEDTVLTPGGSDEVRTVLNNILAAIDADPKYDTQITTDSSTQFAFSAIRTVTNTPFEGFADAGFGLRIEFRDISP